MSTNVSTTSGNNNGNKIYLIKTDGNGDTLWTRKYGMPSDRVDALFQAMEQTHDQGFVIIGTTIDTITELWKTYLIKTDSLGFSGGCNEYASDVTLSSITFTETALSVSTQPAELEYSQITVNTFSGSVGITTLCSNLSALEFLPGKDNSLGVFPNSFCYQAMVQSGEILYGANLSVFNLLGKEVKKINNISGESFALERGGLSSGFYFIYLSKGSKNLATGKIVITDY